MDSNVTIGQKESSEVVMASVPCSVFLTSVALNPLCGLISLALCLLFLYQCHHSSVIYLSWKNIIKNYTQLSVKPLSSVPQDSIIRPTTTLSLFYKKLFEKNKLRWFYRSDSIWGVCFSTVYTVSLMRIYLLLFCKYKLYYIFYQKVFLFIQFLLLFILFTFP